MGNESLAQRWPSQDDYLYEQCLDNAVYHPDTNHNILEAWVFPNLPGPLYLMHRVDSKELVEQLPDVRHVMEGEPAVGGLRMIISDPVANPSLSDHLNIPFSRSVFEQIVQAWGFPKSSVPLCEDLNGFSGWYTKHADGTIDRIAYVTKVWRDISQYELLVSYDPARRQSYCILMGTVSVDEINEIIKFIKEMGDLVLHPMLTPIAVLHSGTLSIQRKVLSLQTSTLNLELQTGQHGWEFKSKELRDQIPVIQDTLSIEFPLLMRMACQINTLVAFFGCRIGTHLLNLDDMEAAFKFFAQIAPEEDSLLPFQRFFLIGQRIDRLRILSKNMVLTLKELEQRTQNQSNVINNYHAHRDSVLNFEVAKDSKALAAASRRDSSSMKTVAILTMFFLPGTFIAALFAMPLLKWDTDKSSPIMTKHFWRYWAFTIPLTIAVILCWAVWIAIKSRRHAREDKAAGITDDEIFKPVGVVPKKDLPEEEKLVNPGSPDEIKIQDANAEIKRKRWKWISGGSDLLHQFQGDFKDRRNKDRAAREKEISLA